ncbi:MAG: hypothetical protein JXB15_15465 [Anaerolineales bacterium]|nr:hypothetical protein [Anaerolineales bacterium]
MSKKLYIPIVIALLVAVIAGAFVSSGAYAKTKEGLAQVRRPHTELGKITQVADDRFTMEKRDGSTATFLVNDETRFFDKEKTELSLADVKVGQWVGVAAPKGEAEDRTARLVLILPEDFDPENMSGAAGTISSVNAGAAEFTLKNRQGEEVTFLVNEETKFLGQVADLASLEVGMAGMVRAEEQDDGSLLAISARAGYPVAKKVGEITAVNQDDGTFTLKTLRGGEELTIQVDEETRYRTKDGELNGLGDLQPGMMGAVLARSSGEEGVFQAAVVIALDKKELPKVDKRAIGKVLSVDKNAFTIQARDGQEYTFQVTGDTKFRSRGGQVQSLEDLKEGMLVIVGAKELGNGEYQAQVVLAGRGMR